MSSSDRPPYEPGPEFGGLEHSPFTPAGQIEQVGAFSSGVRRLSPGKRAMVLTVVLVALGGPLLIIIAAMVFAD